MDSTALDIIAAVINSLKYSNIEKYRFVQKFVVLTSYLTNYLNKDMQYTVSMAALLKDVGVIGKNEKERMKNVYRSAEIIRIMPEILPAQYIIADIILEVNERIDGSGAYKKKDISYEAQIIGVVVDYLQLGCVDELFNPERYNLEIVNALTEVIKEIEAKLLDKEWVSNNFSEIIRINSQNTIEIKGVEEEQFLTTIAAVIDTQHEYTGGHTRRVATYSYSLAKHMGYRGVKLSEIRYAAYLHDIGKLAVDFNLLDKPSSLTNEEFESIKQHAELSYKILQDSPTLKNLRYGALHHERIDGRGYPFGLCGDAIPEQAKIIAIADVLDALTSNRPYRKPSTFKEALKIMEKSMVGSALDPAIFEVAKKVF